MEVAAKVEVAAEVEEGETDVAVEVVRAKGAEVVLGRDSSGGDLESRCGEDLPPDDVSECAVDGTIGGRWNSWRKAWRLERNNTIQIAARRTARRCRE